MLSRSIPSISTRYHLVVEADIMAAIALPPDLELMDAMIEFDADRNRKTSPPATGRCATAARTDR